MRSEKFGCFASETESKTKKIAFDIVLLFLLGLICIVSFLLLNEGFIALITSWGWTPREVLIDTANFWMWLLAVLVLAILPAVVEEIVFRGLLLKLFLRVGVVFAVIASSIIFAIYHLNWAQLVYQFIFGIILASIVVRTKRLWYAMILHFINNFIVITYTYIVGDTGTLAFNWQTIFIMFTVAIMGSLFAIAIVKSLSVKGEEKNRKAID